MFLIPRSPWPPLAKEEEELHGRDSDVELCQTPVPDVNKLYVLSEVRMKEITASGQGTTHNMNA